MNVRELIAIADQIEGIIRRARTFGKSRNEVLDDLAILAEHLNKCADDLENDMYAEYLADMEKTKKKSFCPSFNG
jgi:hypothetical protein